MVDGFDQHTTIERGMQRIEWARYLDSTGRPTRHWLYRCWSGKELMSARVITASDFDWRP